MERTITSEQCYCYECKEVHAVQWVLAFQGYDHGGSNWEDDEYDPICAACGSDKINLEIGHCEACEIELPLDELKRVESFHLCPACMAEEVKSRIHPLFANIINMHFGA